MKRFLLIAVLAAAVLSAPAEEPPPGVLLDSYAAIVNGKVITVGDVLAALQPLQERLAADLQGPALAERLAEEYDAIRDRLVESELILLDFEAQGGTLPDRAIEDHINSVIHDQFNNDRAAFLRALAAERLTYAEWRRQMKDQLIVRFMRQREVAAKILIAPIDIQRAYDRNRAAYSQPERVLLRTLVLPPAEASESADEALARAAGLREQLVSGDLLFDDAPGTPSIPEWYDAANLNDAIRGAVEGLQAGGISEPVELAGDLYLVQLLERREARILSLDEAAPDLEKELRRTEFDRLNRAWIDSLRSKYFVQTFSHDLFE